MSDTLGNFRRHAFYHGTSLEAAEKIAREGLRVWFHSVDEPAERFCSGVIAIVHVHATRTPIDSGFRIVSSASFSNGLVNSILSPVTLGDAEANASVCGPGAGNEERRAESSV
jgi:hypothetical protein